MANRGSHRQMVGGKALPALSRAAPALHYWIGLARVNHWKSRELPYVHSFNCCQSSPKVGHWCPIAGKCDWARIMFV